MENSEVVASIEARLGGLFKRVSDLENKNNAIEKDILEISLDLKYLKQSQDALNANLSKFLWIVGGGFVAGVVGFIIRGGLVI